MSPRNRDDSSCKSDHFSGECTCTENLDFIPNILHKKHKVIKLIEAQLMNFHGLFDSNFSKEKTNEGDNEQYVLNLRSGGDESSYEGLNEANDLNSMESQSNEPTSSLLWLLWLILIVMAFFITGLLLASIAAGPLSNRAPHTPIPWSSLIKTDSVCELEKKYLLRWTTSNHLE